MDDEPAQRKLMQTILGTYYDVLAVPSGEAALALLRQRTFELLVTDAEMGGMSGFDLLSQVGRTHPGLKALLVSGNIDDARQQWLKDHNIDAVAKPFRVPELLNRVAALLDGVKQ